MLTPDPRIRPYFENRIRFRSLENPDPTLEHTQDMDQNLSFFIFRKIKENNLKNFAPIHIRWNKYNKYVYIKLLGDKLSAIHIYCESNSIFISGSNPWFNDIVQESSKKGPPLVVRLLRVREKKGGGKGRTTKEK